MLVKQPSVTHRRFNHSLPSILSESITDALFAQERVYADFASNLIAGRHVSLARKGIVSAPEEAAAEGIGDPLLRISGSGLLRLVTGLNADPDNIHATCVLSTRRGQSSLIAPALERDGWHTIVRELNWSGREKAVDTTVAGEMMEHALMSNFIGVDPASVRVTLLAGDGDYVDVIERLRRYGYEVHVMAWAHSMSSQLRAVATRCTELDPYFSQITFYAH